MHTSNVVDAMLADYAPTGRVDPTISEGLRRGQDFKALSAQADQGILDELFGEGDHKMAAAQTANRSGLVAASEGWRQSAAARKAQETTYDAQPHTVDDLQNGQFKDACDDSILGDIAKHASADDPQNLADIGKKYVNDGDIKKWICDQLTLGKSPSQVFAALRHRATQEVFDHTGMDEFLKDQSGLMGMSYIDPNYFHQKDCKASLAHIRAYGQLRAASVKRIAACEGCSECKCGPDGKAKCATYNRPIVGNAQELGHVVASLTGGTMKKAALVARHNGTGSTWTPGHSSNVIASRTAPAQPQKTAGSSAGLSHFDSAEFKTANSTFTPASIVASLNEGTPFARIFAAAKLEHGTQIAERVCRAYLDTLKGSGQRINLASLDCTLLKRRLTSSETILGASKCASCSFRNTMHCGLTGGTILSYPGMGKEAATRKQASMTPSVPDGVQSMNAMQMVEPELTIDYAGPRNLLQVDVPGVS